MIFLVKKVVLDLFGLSIIMDVISFFYCYYCNEKVVIIRIFEILVVNEKELRNSNLIII